MPWLVCIVFGHDGKKKSEVESNVEVVVLSGFDVFEMLIEVVVAFVYTGASEVAVAAAAYRPGTLFGAVQEQRKFSMQT